MRILFSALGCESTESYLNNVGYHSNPKGKNEVKTIDAFLLASKPSLPLRQSLNRCFIDFASAKQRGQLVLILNPLINQKYPSKVRPYGKVVREIF